MQLVIFTDRYPYGQYEETFVANEINYLAAQRQEFNVIVVPFRGDTTLRPVPKGVYAERPLLSSMHSAQWAGLLVRLLTRRSFWSFLAETLRCYTQGIRLRRVWFSRYFAAEIVARYAAKSIAKSENGILYSYWMHHGALGAALAICRAKNSAHWRCICRAHRYDIFEATDGIPLRAFTWRWLNAIFPVSAAGAAELLKQRGAIGSKLHIAYLGVDGLAQPASPQLPENTALFVSCSSAKPIKRLDLMLGLIASYAANNPNLSVLWIHFGSGELLPTLQAKAAAQEQQLNNFKVQWKGSTPNAEILQAYQSLGGAIFINTSANEGLPVTIMEALSAGFPIVATNVGGTAEAVTNGAGTLLSASPSPQEFAKAIDAVRSNYAHCATQARAIFEERFCAKNNYKLFYDTLLSAATPNRFTPQ